MPPETEDQDQQPPDQSATPDLDELKAIAHRFESIGDNCEFGFVQRSLGHEAGGLLRWSVTPPDSLINALSNRFEGLYAYENLTPSADDMVCDNKYRLFFHSTMKSKDRVFLDDDEHRRQLYETELEKVSYLRNKFLTRLQQPDCILVYKTNARIPDEKAQTISELLSGLGLANLLLVQQSDKSLRVERASDRLLIGSISALAPYEKADAVAYEQWYEIMKAAAGEND